MQSDQEVAMPKDFKGVMGEQKACETSLAEETQNHTAASSNFADTARMASTPFSLGVEPSLPSLPYSTIRPNAETNQFLVQSQEDIPEDPSKYATFAQASGTFMCTPSKKLSPIMERSDEDAKSVASSSSSSQSSCASLNKGVPSGSQGHHTVVSVSELSQIHEEPSTSRTFHGSDVDEIRFKEDGTTGINPFADNVEDMLLAKIVPSVSSYEGFYQSEKEMPKIAPNLAVGLGKNISDVFVRVCVCVCVCVCVKHARIHMHKNLTS